MFEVDLGRVKRGSVSSYYLGIAGGLQLTSKEMTSGEIESLDLEQIVDSYMAQHEIPLPKVVELAGAKPFRQEVQNNHKTSAKSQLVGVALDQSSDRTLRILSSEAWGAVDGISLTLYGHVRNLKIAPEARRIGSEIVEFATLEDARQAVDSIRKAISKLNQELDECNAQIRGYMIERATAKRESILATVRGREALRDSDEFETV
ncbi:MAG: hypothetical protein AAF842_07480 [Planctomycetota bacterium]